MCRFSCSFVTLVFFFIACSGPQEAPSVIAESYFDAAAKQDSGHFLSVLTDSSRQMWSNPLSHDRLTYAVLGGVDFKIQTLTESASKDSAKVTMALTFLNVRDERLRQSVKLHSVETVHVSLVSQEDRWRIAGIR